MAFFALLGAACAGACILIPRLRGSAPSADLPLVLAHGLCAVTGVALLLLGVALSGVGVGALPFLVASAAGGALLLSSDLRGQGLRRQILAAHVAAAVLGVLILFFGLVRSGFLFGQGY
jgi:hypothetical protein